MDCFVRLSVWSSALHLLSGFLKRSERPNAISYSAPRAF